MSFREAGRAFVLLVARVLLAGIFVYGGIKSFGSISATTAHLAEVGYPAPKVMAIVAATAEVAGGASLAVGLLTPVGCLALILFLLPVTYTYHLGPARAGDVTQRIAVLHNLGLLGGLLLLMVTGPGRWSVDGRRRAARAKSQ